MAVNTEMKETTLNASISGEIDHHNAKGIREEIDCAIEKNRPKELILDMSEVGFMDSSGIGLVMGRYKIMRENGGTVTVQSCIPSIKKVMRLAGLDKVVKIKD